MKYAIIVIMLFASAFCALAATYQPGAYLRVVEIVGPYDIPIDIWVPASSREDAIEKIPAVVAEYFSEKSYQAYFHQHFLDRPCVEEPIP